MSTKRRRILVVDDLENVARAISDELSSDFDVEIASSGMEALQRLKRSRFDGLIVDIDLDSGMNGLEMVTRARRAGHLLPVMIVSAVAYSDSVRRQAVELGATFCEKPVRGEQMRGALQGSGGEQDAE